MQADTMSVNGGISKRNASLIASDEEGYQSLSNSGSIIDVGDSSFGSVVGSDSNSESDNDIDLQINFLRRKGRLLKRVFQAMQQEEAYCASVARQECTQPKESHLWTEAKDILRVLYRGEPGPDLFVSSSERTRQTKRKMVQLLDHEDQDCPDPPKKTTSPKHPRIDIGLVKVTSMNDEFPLQRPTVDLSHYSLCLKQTSLPLEDQEQRENARWMTDLLHQINLPSAYFDGSEDDLAGSMDLIQATALSIVPR